MDHESVQHKYDAFRNIILNLTRCNYCDDVGGNIENLSIKTVNDFNINQDSIVYFHSFTHISCMNCFVG